MKNHKNQIAVSLLLAALSFMGIFLISENASAAVTKSGVWYPSKVRMEVNSQETIHMQADLHWDKYDNKHVKFKVIGVSTDNKSLKVRKSSDKGYYSGNDIYLYAKKKGDYTVTVTWKAEGAKKSEKIHISVAVGDTIPIQGITLDGKKLKKEEGESYAYLSQKSSGKMKITPKAGYEVTKIQVFGSDADAEVNAGWGDEYEPHYHFGGKARTVKNGGQVVLNSGAEGSTCRIDIRDDREFVGEMGDPSPYYLSEEEYSMTMAATKLFVYYQVKGSDMEQSMEITVYTPAGK